MIFLIDERTLETPFAHRVRLERTRCAAPDLPSRLAGVRRLLRQVGRMTELMTKTTCDHCNDHELGVLLVRLGALAEQVAEVGRVRAALVYPADPQQPCDS
jgi:hypothetical protein